MESKLKVTPKPPKKDNLDKIIDKAIMAMDQYGYNGIDRAGVLKNETMSLFFESILDQAGLDEVQVKAVIARLKNPR